MSYTRMIKELLGSSDGGMKKEMGFYGSFLSIFGGVIPMLIEAGGEIEAVPTSLYDTNGVRVAAILNALAAVVPLNLYIKVIIAICVFTCTLLLLFSLTTFRE